MNDFKNLNIAVAGTGYVGLSIATLLAQHHQVTAVDVIPEKVEKINNHISPIQDEYIEKYLAEKELNLTATLDGASAYKNADFVVIAAPTNYDPVKNYFDTSHVEEVIDLVLEVNPDAVMVIKSTIPVGYCRSLYVKYAEKFKNTPALAGKKFNPERRFTIVKNKKVANNTNGISRFFRRRRGSSATESPAKQQRILRCTQGRDQAVIHPALSRTDRGNDAGDGQDRPAVRHRAVPHGIPRAARYPIYQG